MSRNRFHFQGFRLADCMDDRHAANILADLEAAWDRVLDGDYAMIPLSNFLLDESSQEFQRYVKRLQEKGDAAVKPARQAPPRKGKVGEKQDPAWVTLHQRVFLQHQAAFKTIVTCTVACFAHCGISKSFW